MSEAELQLCQSARPASSAKTQEAVPAAKAVDRPGSGHAPPHQHLRRCVLCTFCARKRMGGVCALACYAPSSSAAGTKRRLTELTQCLSRRGGG